MYSIAKERVCTKCGVNKPIEEFGWKDRTRGYRHWVCKECTAQRSSDWYYSNRDRQKENVKRNNQNYREQARLFVLNFLLKHPCTNCGESDPRVLEFHHEGDKENEVSRLMGRGASLEVLKSEMDKCKVLCANCFVQTAIENLLQMKEVGIKGDERPQSDSNAQLRCLEGMSSIH